MADAGSKDRTKAMALQIAHQYLVTQGWKFTMADVGKRAREIVDALDGIEPKAPSR